MTPDESPSLADLLQQVADGRCSVDAALAALVDSPERDLQFARVDIGRLQRCGIPEVVYAEGKTPDQVVAIVRTMQEQGQRVLVTRIPESMVPHLERDLPEAILYPLARCLVWQKDGSEHPLRGRVGVVSAGTSDQAVAEEACLAAEHVGATVERYYDIGVAGLHRLLSRLEDLRRCNVLVVVAGMEGALPSVVGGLVACPVIAVPTSVGYGMNLDGLSALLGMLNSCAAGITVVNVDNGFGAGVAAGMINRVGATS